jgi:NitT/TauT family transport system ATP-binding protein
MKQPIAEAIKLNKTFTDPTGREFTAVEDFSLRIFEGEWVALLGQSGSGKSTILRCLIGLSPPTSGEVLCRGRPFQGVHPEASMVFQTFALFPWLTVEENIAVPLLAGEWTARSQKKAVHDAIELIGLTHYHAAYPRELSGGMRQRVAIARALVANPGLLCLDEAFSGLDVLTGENLRQEMLALWHRRDTSLKSVLMVTHNIEEAVETATRIAVLFPNPGRLGLILENSMPYPRDPQSAEFRQLVATIHESIIRQCMPDAPPVEHVTQLSQQTLPPMEQQAAMQAIPSVAPGQILGLLSILEDAAPEASVYSLSNAIGREFGEIIALVTAAELLGLVETPGNTVRLTELGLRFHAAHHSERRLLFGRQIQKLGLFRQLVAHLQRVGTLSESDAIKRITAALPYDNPQRLLQTIVAWGRYAGLLDWDATNDCLRLIHPLGATDSLSQDMNSPPQSGGNTTV